MPVKSHYGSAAPVRSFEREATLLAASPATGFEPPWGEGTHTVMLERNRMQLLPAVQQFLDESLAPGD